MPAATVELGGASGWAQIAVAIIGLAGVIYATRRASKAEHKSDDFSRITALWDRVDKLEVSDREKGDQIAALMAQNTGQAAQIARLERTLARWREYANRLGQMLRDLGHTPPEPPTDD